MKIRSRLFEYFCYLSHRRPWSFYVFQEHIGRHNFSTLPDHQEFLHNLSISSLYVLQILLQCRSRMTKWDDYTADFKKVMTLEKYRKLASSYSHSVGHRFVRCCTAHFYSATHGQPSTHSAVCGYVSVCLSATLARVDGRIARRGREGDRTSNPRILTVEQKYSTQYTRLRK